jgi:thiamine pyrophosphate-dependent acetolactate synthase large subunit-like protein
VLCLESPRGLNDAAQGALAGIVARADLIVLLGKQADFALRFGEAPAIASTCRFAVVDPDTDVLKHAPQILGQQRIAFAAQADSLPAANRLIERAARRRAAASGWVGEVEAQVRARPAEWATHVTRPDGPVHPLDVGRAVQSVVDSAPGTVFIADGGEFCQWMQACVQAPARIINGPGGSIGSGIPFALAAKMARPGSPVIATSGDGSCGYHLLELETAMRAGLPVVIVVGNDACWNAEHQIQLRAYGKARAHGCELLPARYDLVAAALGAHGEFVTRPGDLPAALSRAAASGKPALVNVMIEGLAAPVMNQG